MPHAYVGRISSRARPRPDSAAAHFGVARLTSRDRRNLGAFRAASMDESTFRRLSARAGMMAKVEPERADYWHGYRRGLMRARFGSRFASDAEHEAWLAMADSPDRVHADLGCGYLDGLTAALK